MKVGKQRSIYCEKSLLFSRDFQDKRIGTTTYLSTLNICSLKETGGFNTNEDVTKPHHPMVTT
jgi:hypothetical protein